MDTDPHSELRRLTTRVMAGRAFAIKTPLCLLYLRNMMEWLETGALGSLVTGAPRLGKSMATRWVLHVLAQVLGRVPWVEIPLRSQYVATEREFFQHVLRCCRHRHYAQGTAGDRRDRLTEWLIPRARRSSVNAVVLFIDEAHIMSMRHFVWLQNVSNELDAAGCRLFCLLVGQPALLLKKETYLEEEGGEQIVGRFMVRELSFTGICSDKDFLSCLQGFDSAEYPPASGVTFRANFIPRATEAGFALATLAPAAWAEFKTASDKAGLSDVVVPMHYLTSFVMNVLSALASEDCAGIRVERSVIGDALKKSGFIESAKVRNAAANFNGKPYKGKAA